MKERFLEVLKRRTETARTVPDLAQRGGDSFADERAQAAYRERVTLLKEAIQMKQRPARIPVCPQPDFSPCRMRALPCTMPCTTTGHSKGLEIYHRDFEPDAYNSPMTIVPGKVLDILT